MRVLLVEDDKNLAMAVAYYLKKEGYELTSCPDGKAGLEALEAERYDLMVLDRMMPVMSGDELLRRMRAAQIEIPVLMLTAMDGVSDRVAGLDLGADDYLVKPFAMEELLARLRALSRRQSQWVPLDTIIKGDLTLKRDELELSSGGRCAVLSRREAVLLEVLMTNSGQVLPRGLIMDKVWADSDVEEGNLDIYIHFLRKHLKALRSSARIDTVRGVGYRLIVL